jgi:alanine racemase
MDMLTVDVTDHPDARVGALAVLWGEDPGVDEIASYCGTIGYELLAALPARVKRVIEQGLVS